MSNSDKNDIHIDVSMIPKCNQDILAVATLNLVRGILKQPGGREILDKKIKEVS